MEALMRPAIASRIITIFSLFLVNVPDPDSLQKLTRLPPFSFVK